MIGKLSPTMEEALSWVPLEWARPPYEHKMPKLRGRYVGHPLFQPTFVALRNRGLIEWRGGPGKWEWRRKP